MATFNFSKFRQRQLNEAARRNSAAFANGEEMLTIRAWQYAEAMQGNETRHGLNMTNLPSGIKRAIEFDFVVIDGKHVKRAKSVDGYGIPNWDFVQRVS